MAHSTRPCAGEQANGDAAVVRQSALRSMLAVVDALGHGAVAAQVAEVAARWLERWPIDAAGDGDARLRSIMEELDLALRGTRGAAATVCLVDGDRLWGCGVGNVEVRTIGGELPAQLSPGVLGVRVRALRLFRGRLRPGQRLALFSDGVSRRVDIARTRELAPADACGRILDEHSHPHDDATIVIGDVEASA